MVFSILVPDVVYIVAKGRHRRHSLLRRACPLGPLRRGVEVRPGAKRNEIQPSGAGPPHGRGLVNLAPSPGGAPPALPWPRSGGDAIGVLLAVRSRVAAGWARGRDPSTCTQTVGQLSLGCTVDLATAHCRGKAGRSAEDRPSPRRPSGMRKAPVVRAAGASSCCGYRGTLDGWAVARPCRVRRAVRVIGCRDAGR